MTAPVAIVVAMNSELRHLVPPGIKVVDLTAGIWTETHFAVGTLPLIAVRSGIGMVAAAAATEHVVARYQPTAVLNFGCTGSHVRDQYPGDVVIGSGSVAHATFRIAPDGEEIYDRNVFSVGSDSQAANVFESDPRLVAVARDAARGWLPDPWPVGDPPRLPGVRVGYVGSADVWTQHSDRLEVLHGRHQTLCEDMEAAAIAQVAALHGVPFLTIKDISNNEFLDVTDFSEHGAGILEEELGRRAAELTWRVLERMTLR